MSGIPSYQYSKCMTHTNNDVFWSIEHTTIIYPRDLWFIYWIMGSQGWFVSTYPLILLHMNFQQKFVCMSKVFVCVNNFVPNCFGCMSTTFCNMSVILWQNFGSIQVSCLWFWGAPLMTCRSSRWRHFLGLTGSPRWILGASACVRGCYKCLKPCPISDGAHFEQVSSTFNRYRSKQEEEQVTGHPTKVSYHCTSWYVMHTRLIYEASIPFQDARALPVSSLGVSLTKPRRIRELYEALLGVLYPSARA